jgi:hypothetical protein
VLYILEISPEIKGQIYFVGLLHEFMGLEHDIHENVFLTNKRYFPVNMLKTAWVRAQLCKLQKWCTRLAAASNKVYQLLARGQWFSPGTPAFSTTKPGRHDIAEILLKVALNTINQSAVIYRKHTKN